MGSCHICPLLVLRTYQREGNSWTSDDLKACRNTSRNGMQHEATSLRYRKVRAFWPSSFQCYYAVANQVIHLTTEVEFQSPLIRAQKAGSACTGPAHCAPIPQQFVVPDVSLWGLCRQCCPGMDWKAGKKFWLARRYPSHLIPSVSEF